MIETDVTPEESKPMSSSDPSPVSSEERVEQNGSSVYNEDVRSPRSSISSLGSQIGASDSEFLPNIQNANNRDTDERKADNDDDIAELMSKMISSKNRSITLGFSLAERAAIIESINWLGRHVPQCVLNRLCQDIIKLNEESKTPKIIRRRSSQIMAGHSTSTSSSSASDRSSKPLEMPLSETYEAALLFIDMSGFTKLSQLLDVESLSKVRCFVEMLCFALK